MNCVRKRGNRVGNLESGIQSEQPEPDVIKLMTLNAALPTLNSLSIRICRQYFTHVIEEGSHVFKGLIGQFQEVFAQHFLVGKSFDQQELFVA